MYRIIDGRATGKTSRLMLIAKENNALFVCGNPNAMREKAYAYGVTGIDFMNYLDFIKEQPDREFVIDELELFMKIFHPTGKMIGYSLSEED